jgi:hypothetical protein
MTSENRITHRGQAAMGSLKKLFGRGPDEHYESWVVSIQPDETEPPGEAIRDSVKR